MPGLLTFRSRQCGTQANNTNPVQLSFLGDFRRLCPLNNVQIRSTLVYRIDVQGKINVQVEKFLKNIKRAGQNRRAGEKPVKSIIVQVGFFCIVLCFPITLF